MAFAAASAVATGCTWGIDDHHIHLPLLLGVPEGDLLAEARHPSSLWPLARWWFLRFGGAGLVAAWWAVAAATGAALGRLGQAMGASAPAQWLALGVLAAGQPALGGAWTSDPLVLHRTAALPVELLAMALALRGRREAWPLVGLALGMHAPSGTACGAAVAAVVGIRLRDGALASLLAAPATLAWMAAPGPLWIDEAWWAVLERRVPHHVAPGTWAAGTWLAGLGWLGAWAGVALRRGSRGAGVPPPGRSRATVDDDAPRGSSEAVPERAAVVMLWTWALALGGAGAGGLALAVQLEPWQATRLAVVLCVLGVARQVLPLPAREAEAGTGAGSSLRFSTRVALLLAAVAVAWPTRPAPRPPAPVPPGLSAALAECTGPVVVPPVGWEHLRWRLGVPLYGTWKDGGEGTFSRPLALEWRRRMDVLAGPFDERAPGPSMPELREALSRGFERRWRSLQPALREQGVQCLVVAGPAPERHAAGPGWSLIRLAR